MYAVCIALAYANIRPTAQYCINIQWDLLQNKKAQAIALVLFVCYTTRTPRTTPRTQCNIRALLFACAHAVCCACIVQA